MDFEASLKCRSQETGQETTTRKQPWDHWHTCSFAGWLTTATPSLGNNYTGP